MRSALVSAAWFTFVCLGACSTPRSVPPVSDAAGTGGGDGVVPGAGGAAPAAGSGGGPSPMGPGTGGAPSGTGGGPLQPGTGGSAPGPIDAPTNPVDVRGTGGAGNLDAPAPPPSQPPTPPAKLTLTVEHDVMNGRACFKPTASNNGGNRSPKVDWTGVPAGTQSLVFTLTDTTGVPHYVLCNLPPTTTGLMADIRNYVPPGAQVSYGHNKTTWYGPGAANIRAYELRIWALPTAVLPSGCPVANAAYLALKQRQAEIPYAEQILYGNAAGACF